MFCFVYLQVCRLLSSFGKSFITHFMSHFPDPHEDLLQLGEAMASSSTKGHRTAMALITFLRCYMCHLDIT